MRDLPVTYVIFDLLYLDGHYTLPLPYEERRALLERLELEGAVVAHAGLPPRRGQRAARGHPADGRGGRGGQAARQPVRAGTALRRAGSRSRTCTRRTWSSAAGRPARAAAATSLGALAVGVMDGRRARYAGKVGTGLHRDHADDAPARARAAARATTRRSPAASRRRARSSWSRASWPRWSSANGPARGPSALPRSRAFATTRTRKIASVRRVKAPSAGYLVQSMARAIWSGAISFGLVNIPVKLYSAVSRKTVRFHQLDGETGQRIAAAPGEPGDRRGGPLRAARQGLRDRPRPLRDHQARGARLALAREDAHDRHRGLRRSRPDRPDLLRPPLLPRARHRRRRRPTGCSTTRWRRRARWRSRGWCSATRRASWRSARTTAC